MRNDKFNFVNIKWRFYSFEEKIRECKFSPEKTVILLHNICKVFANPFSHIFSYFTETKFDPWVLSAI